ncbi:MAG: RHS repeat-associated core domain-containing protein [Opitutaceae bacterium]
MTSKSATCLIALLAILLLPADIFSAGDYAGDWRPRLQSRAGIDVDTATGAFIEEINLVSLQGERELSLGLTYNSSLASSRRGAVGYGWTHPYEAKIAFLGGQLTAFLNNNQLAFYPNNDRPSWYSSDAFEPSTFVLVQQPDYFGRNWFLRQHGSGTAYHFTESGRLTRITDSHLRELTVTRYLDGSVGTVLEPVTHQKIDLYYRNMSASRYQHYPLLSVVSYADLFRFLKYDEHARLSRIYDPTRFFSAVYGSDGGLVDPGEDGAFYDLKVTRTDTGRLVRVVAFIDGENPENLVVAVITPGGKRIPVNYRFNGENSSRSFLVMLLLDDYLDESPEGTWRLHVVNQSENQSYRISGFGISLSYDAANWTEYDYVPWPSKRIARATDSEGKQIYANLYDAKGRVERQFGAAGSPSVWQFSYDGPKTTVESGSPAPGRGKSAVEFVHDDLFNLLSVKDEIGNKTVFTYLPGTRSRTSILDPEGNLTRFEYAYFDKERLTAIIEPNGSTTQFETFNGSDVDSYRLISVKDQLGRETKFVSSAAKLVNVTSPNGQRQYREYSEKGQLIKVTNKGLRASTTQGTLAVPTDVGNQDSISFEYDANGRLKSVVPDHNREETESIEYDGAGRLKTLSDGAFNAFSFDYDALGNIVKLQNDQGEAILKTYDYRNELVREMDPMGKATLYDYNGDGNLTSITNALGEVTTFGYDRDGRLATITDTAGNTAARYTYDLAGRVQTEVADGDRFNYRYDRNGNTVEVTDSYGSTLSETIYNELNLPVSVIDARGKVTNYEYDVLGQVISRTDPSGAKTSFRYDAMNRIDRVTDANGRSFTRVYESDDVVKEVIDADGKKTLFTYTPKNELATITTPKGQVTTFEYTGNGFVNRYVTPSGKVQEYTYDKANRLTRTYHAKSSHPDYLYEYDKNGNRTKVSTRAGATGTPEVKIVQAYDALNRTTSVEDAEGKTVSYAYDPAGQVAQVTYPDLKAVEYTYDEAGRVVALRDWAGRVTRYTWGPGGQIEAIAFPNGTSRSMQYNDQRILLKRSDFDARGAVIVSYEYSYSEDGRISAELVAGTYPTAYSPTETTYTYGEDNELTGDQFAFDADGNLTRGPINGQTNLLNWNARNNMIQVGDLIFHYDVEDRLVGWTKGGETVKLTVVDAAEGARVLVAASSTGSVTRYVYGVGLVYEETDGVIKVHHYDARGSTTALSGADGTVSGRISYSPFGSVIGSVDDTDTLFKYGGLFGVMTVPNGLNHMRYRWYSPEMRRFISMDSVLGDIELPGSLNRYVYAGNDPINFNDPQGEFLNGLTALVGAGIGAVVGATIEVVGSAIANKPIEWNRVASAAIGGAVTGGIIGALPVAGALGSGVGYFASRAAASATGSVVEDAAYSLLSGKEFDVGDVAFNAGVSAGVSVGLGLGGKYIPTTGAYKAVASGARRIGNAIRPNTTRSSIAKVAGLGSADSALKAALKREAKRGLKRSVTGGTGFAWDVSYGDRSTPPGKAGTVIRGATGAPTSAIGKGGEYLHYQRFLEALTAADRPLPDPIENLSTF